MKIYTRKGDRGQTGVFGGKREYKDSPRIECNGALDEANSTIGLLRSKLGRGEWQPNLHRIQKDLMDMMSHLARPRTRPRKNTNPRPIDGATFCEEWIDALETAMTEPSDYFLLPAETRSLHYAPWCVRRYAGASGGWLLSLRKTLPV